MVVCKWCGLAEAGETFTQAPIYGICHEKATEEVRQEPCLDCKSLFTDFEVLKSLTSEDGFAHSTLELLTASAAKGCPLCRIFLLEDKNTDPTRLRTLYLFAESGISNDILAQNINSLYFWSEPDQYKLTVSVSAAEGNPAAKYIKQRPIDTTLANEVVFQQARSWIGKCLSTHEEGIKPGSHPPLPTRVLDVGDATDTNVKLFEPSVVTHAPYITLSYCWGREPFLTTLYENIEAHKKAIPNDLLPNTIKDAITATRLLGYRYLWVDALCVIQDPEPNPDKAQEIGRMGDNYHNSSLTIAAVSASASSEGFLQPKQRVIAELPYRCPDGEMGSVQVAYQKMVNLWDESMYTRGWCLQEFLLSGRLLLFTDTEVVWSCQRAPFERSNTTHVTYNYELPKETRSPFRRLPENIFIGPQKTTPPEKPTIEEDGPFNLETFKEWTSLISNYSHRLLSYGTDRLPAVSGVAEKFQQSWNSQYYAGLWNQQFSYFLAWRRTISLPKLDTRPFLGYPQPKSWRAPSWSWASIEGPLTFEFQNGLLETKSGPDLSKIPAEKRKLMKEVVKQPVSDAKYISDAQLISCTVTPKYPSAPFGELLPPSLLEISGHLIPASASPMTTKSIAEAGNIYWDSLPFQYMPPTLPTHNSSTSKEGSGGTLVLENCYCLLLAEGWSHAPKTSEAVVLILEKLEGTPGKEERFRRVGLHTYRAKAAGKAWVGRDKVRRIFIE